MDDFHGRAFWVKRLGIDTLHKTLYKRRLAVTVTIVLYNHSKTINQQSCLAMFVAFEAMHRLTGNYHTLESFIRVQMFVIIKPKSIPSHPG